MRKVQKRISLSAYDAEHVYEWLRMYWRGDGQKFGACALCDRIGRRLERLIGPTSVRHVVRLVNKHPGKRRQGQTTRAKLAKG
jgi:hypothetical protein